MCRFAWNWKNPEHFKGRFKFRVCEFGGAAGGFGRPRRLRGGKIRRRAGAGQRSKPGGSQSDVRFVAGYGIAPAAGRHSGQELFFRIQVVAVGLLHTLFGDQFHTRTPAKQSMLANPDSIHSASFPDEVGLANENCDTCGAWLDNAGELSLTSGPMTDRTLTLGHSPDPDDAFMFFALAHDRIPTHGFRFQHILEDIQTLNERATRGELDVSAISIHAYAYVSGQYALLPSGASMGDGYGPMLVAKACFDKDEVARKRIAVPGTMTSAFLALQLWLDRPARELDYIVVPFDRIFAAVRDGQAEVGLIIHEGQLTYAREGLALCEDLGIWWNRETNGLPLPLGGNVVHKRFSPAERRQIASILSDSIRYSLDHRDEAVAYAMNFARDMGRDLADRFVGMYVNHWTIDYGDQGRESIRRFLHRAHERGLIPHRQELEFVE